MTLPSENGFCSWAHKFESMQHQKQTAPVKGGANLPVTFLLVGWRLVLTGAAAAPERPAINLTAATALGHHWLPGVRGLALDWPL